MCCLTCFGSGVIPYFKKEGGIDMNTMRDAPAI